MWSRIPTAAKAVSGIIGTVAAIVGILATLGVFKGGDTETQDAGAAPDSGPTRAAWARRANDACRRERRELAALPVSNLFFQETVSVEGLQHILESWPDLIAIVEKKQNAIQAIPRPDADAASIERMLTLWDQAAQQLTHAGEAGRLGQWSLYGQLYRDASVVSERASENARQLGATECRGL